jgi:hypothetical protein
MFTHHLYTLISSCFISLVTKWECDSFHSPLYTLVSNNFISLVSKWDCNSFHSPLLHFHIQLCYEVGVHILLFFSVLWPNEIVTYFTHFLYTLISNCLVLKWYYKSYHSPPLNVNVTKCLFIRAGVIANF